MKKNLISVVILALLIVNIVLTSVMMFSVVNTNQKTATLVGDIASALALDLSGANGEQEAQEPEVSIANTATYNFEDKMTIPLASDDGKEHYFVTSVVLSLNTKDKGYKKYNEGLTANVGLIKSDIYDVISAYTVDDLKADNNEAAANEILGRIQAMYDSEFVFKVSFSDYMYQ